MIFCRHARLKAVWLLLAGLGLLSALGLPAEEPSQREESKPPAQARNHWSFQPLRASQVPSGGHPIDAFVLATLRTNGLAQNPPAALRELLRRVYFDLVGLPPTPDEIDAFEKDRAPDRYEKIVDRLLASPRYGERWARHWLDVVRYTESQGFEYDRPRDNAWPYRDYVIRSFNEDKPYDRFMREQITGDVLEPVTSEGIIAASLLVSGPWDQAGNSQANATQRATTREEEMEDLVSVVGQTFLGLTVNCARCHDHKFDPIPQADYYRVKAVFDGVRHGERSSEGAAEAKAREERLTTWRRDFAEAQATVARLETEGARLAAAKHPGAPKEPRPAAFARWTFDGSPVAVMPGELKEGATMSGGQLQLPKAGAFFESAPLTHDVQEKTLEAWVSLSDLDQAGGAAISLEAADGHRFDAIVFGERQPRKWMAGSEGFARTRDLDAPEETNAPGTLVHLAAVYSTDNRIALYRNGEPYGQSYISATPLPTFKAGEAHVALGRRHKGGERPWLTGAIQQAALYDRALSAAEVTASFKAGGWVIPQAEILSSLSDGQRMERNGALARMAKASEGIAATGKSEPMVYAGKREQPAPTKILKRGDVTSPGDVVAPSGLSAVTAMTADLGLTPEAPEGQRRLKFAEWLADPRNPLPARVMANRVWQFHFGQGLVTTPSDFGVNGARPSHPALLDWLASEFIASDWSMKALHRLIVTSATYRQSAEEPVISRSVISNQSRQSGGGDAPNTGSLSTDSLITDYSPPPTPRHAASIDADNTLLWRFPPHRLEAEALRDAMLAASGQLNLQLGGPSFRPFTTTEFNATFYHPFDKGDPEFNRRTVYRMNINSGKEPLLDAFDCPDPSVKTPRRGVTTTPLQALALMNSSFVQRQAAGLAERALLLSGNDPDRAIGTAWRLALGRPATEAELERARVAARKRGLANVCWVLLNSTEFVYVR